MLGQMLGDSAKLAKSDAGVAQTEVGLRLLISGSKVRVLRGAFWQVRVDHPFGPHVPLAPSHDPIHATGRAGMPLLAMVAGFNPTSPVAFAAYGG